MQATAVQTRRYVIYFILISLFRFSAVLDDSLILKLKLEELHRIRDIFVLNSYNYHSHRDNFGNIAKDKH